MLAEKLGYFSWKKIFLVFRLSLANNCIDTHRRVGDVGGWKKVWWYHDVREKTEKVSAKV